MLMLLQASCQTTKIKCFYVMSFFALNTVTFMDELMIVVKDLETSAI